MLSENRIFLKVLCKKMSTTKYYAVRTGRQPGLYFTWEDCKEQVEKFPNAEYKSFPSRVDAEEYLGAIGLVREEDLCPIDALFVYTDGSYLNEVAGYGAVFVYNGEVIGKLCGCAGKSKSRNITGELQAVIAAVKTAQARGVKEVYICHDLMGVQMWADELWKSNTPETQAYTEFIRDKRGEGMHIGFGWLHGHRTNPYNKMADQCAAEGSRCQQKKAMGFPLGKEPFCT